VHFGDPNAHLRQKALVASGYSLLAPLIECGSASKGFLQMLGKGSKGSAASIGIYVQR